MTGRPVRLGRAVVAALLLGVALVLGLLPGPTPDLPQAYAAEPEFPVSITLTEMRPALPTRDGTVTLAGTVTNVSDGPVRNLQAILWRDRTAPISSAEALAQSLGSAADNPEGERLYEEDYQNIPSDDDRTLEPGEQTSFSLTTEIASLGFPPVDGVYLFGVHIRGMTPVDTLDLTLGRARTFLPLSSTDPARTLTSTTVVLLTATPATVAPGVLADEHLADEVAAGGRLTDLLEAAATKGPDGGGASFVVDPALVQDLQVMREGYRVLVGPDGTRGSPSTAATVPGRGQADAARWLDRFAELVADGDGYRLPYGAPDLAALVHTDRTEVLKAVTRAGQAVAATRELPLLVLPGGGAADAETLAAAADLDPAAVLLADSVTIGTGPATTGGGPLLAGPDDVPVVSYAAGEAAGGPGPDPRDTTVQVQQRLLAETWLQATTAAATGPTPATSAPTGRGRVRLVSTAAQARAARTPTAAPWLEPTTLADLLETRPDPWDGRPASTPAGRAAELTPRQLDRSERLAAGARAYAELLVDPAAGATDVDAALARSVSWTWRGLDQARQRWLRPQQAVLDATLRDAVSISSPRKVSTVAQEGVVFPVTVINNLPAVPDDPDANAVRVTVTFDSAYDQRLTIRDVEVPEIAAEDNVTVTAEVRARANGVVPVVAQLVTASGSEVGPPVTIDVQVTQNGTTGWAIVGVSGLLLAVTTALRIRQVARERARAATGGPAEAAADPVEQPTPSGLTSAPPTDAASRSPGPVDG